MAGLAALLSFGSDRSTTQTLQALSDALVPRGSDEAVVEFGAARLLVRAALPKVHESGGVVVIVDGIAETSSLITRYSAHGPAGLLYGQHAYAMILAEPDSLVLARNHDGPPLYYAKSRGAVLVASEPGALLATGIPARPNDEIVTRFLATGACDEVPATFFEGIRRVLPGQVVEICRHTDGWAIRAHPPAHVRHGRISARMTLLGALGEERVGVVLDAGLPTAALLGTALAEKSHRAVPVYSANFPGLATTTPSYPSALLGPVPDGAVKHRALPFFADEIDIDGFVADAGEPLPGLAEYLLWATARATGGEVDVLLSAVGWRGPSGHLSRLADRVAARYGVGLRFPYVDLDSADEGTRAELLALAERTLPHASVRAAATPMAGMDLPLHDVVERLRPEIATSLLYPRHGDPDHSAIARLSAARRLELDRLWRHYVLDRWLRTVLPASEKAPATPPPGEVNTGGQAWQRRPIHTDPVAAGERLGDKIAWYTTEFVNSADKVTKQALRQPWLVLVAAKPVAVAQGLARPVWQIEPGWLARMLVRLTRGQCDPWSMQVAIESAGRPRMCATAIRASWTRYPDMVSPPREGACPPADLAVVPPPREPDAAAKEIVTALRRALPGDAFATLRGCAIVRGTEVVGWSGGGAAPEDLVARLCDDDPLGGADQRTPLLVAVAMPRKQGRKPKRR